MILALPVFDHCSYQEEEPQSRLLFLFPPSFSSQPKGTYALTYLLLAPCLLPFFVAFVSEYNKKNYKNESSV